MGQLFHPCRCTGSIAHVHQDCLSTWLAHSNKSSCELCGHLFSFEKVYKPGSPDRPPLTTITFQALKEIFNFFLLFSRAILVGICWLAIVPWTVVWVSTAYWKLADWFAFGLTSNIHQLSKANSSSSQPVVNLTSSSSSESPVIDPKPSTPSSFNSNSSLSHWITSLIPTLDLDPNSIALDIFQGQLITCAIILSFVVIFLLREWIIQNTPPPELMRLAEDEDIPAPVQPQQRLLPPPRLAEEIDRQHPTRPTILASADDRSLAPPEESTQSSQPSNSSSPDGEHLLEPATFTTPGVPEEEKTTRSSQVVSHHRSSSFSTDRSTSSHTNVDQRSLKISTECYPLPDSGLQVSTPGLLALADPGLDTPFYNAHDPIDPDIFSHRILVTSAYLLFIAPPASDYSRTLIEPSSLSLSQILSHPSHLDDNQKKLLKVWIDLRNQLLTDHLLELSSDDVHRTTRTIHHLRSFLSSPSISDDRIPLSALESFEQIEYNWTRTLLNDPKINKLIQHLYHTRSSIPANPTTTRAGQSPSQIRINGLIYSLLSIFILIESQTVIQEATTTATTLSEEFELIDPNSHEGYGRIYDVLRLFVLPLLDVPNEAEHGSQQLVQLESDIHHMIETFNPLSLFHRHQKQPDGREDSLSDLSAMSSLRDTILRILVKQRVLSTLINSSTFVRYSSGMAFDDNLFTNWRLKSTRAISAGYIYPPGVVNPENDLSEITIQLLNYKTTLCEPLSRSQRNQKTDQTTVGLIDHSTLEHKLLVTSCYLLSDQSPDFCPPVLQNVDLIYSIENAKAQGKPHESAPLEVWFRFVKSLTSEPTESVQRIRTFLSSRVSSSHVLSNADRLSSFQRLETGWLSKLISDPSIAQLLVSILSRPDDDRQESARTSNEYNLGYYTPKFFILKLTYVYTVLETMIIRSSSTSPSENKQPSMMVYENAVGILNEHLNRLANERPPLVHHDQVLEIMMRETQFLLDSCKPVKSNLIVPPSSVSSHGSCRQADSSDLRSELLIARLKRGIIGILARQKVFGMIVTDPQFVKYAHAMLSEPGLFSHLKNLPNLEQVLEQDEKPSLLPHEMVDKGKQKASLQTPPINEDRESVIKFDSVSDSSHEPQPLDRSSHLDSSNWLEVTTSSVPSSVHAPTDLKRIEDSVGSDPSSGSNLPPVNLDLGSDEECSSTSDREPSTLPRAGTPAPSRRQRADLQPRPEDQPEPVVNPDINRDGLRIAERAAVVGGHLPGFGPARALQLDGAQLGLAGAGLGMGLGEAFGLDDPGVENNNNNNLAGDDELMAEDIDGILELIGMKGSLLMLAQNVGLMTMLLSLSLLAFVHLPHMIGKIAVLSKAHRLLVPPFKGLLILQRYVHRMLDWVSEYVKVHLLNGYRPSGKLEQILSFLGGSAQPSLVLLPWYDRWPINEMVRSMAPLVRQSRPFLSKLLSFNAAWHHLIERIGDRLNSIAYGSKPIDRALAVLLGYFELVLMSLIYLSSGLDQRRARFVSETIVNGMQQQLLIGKVATFIFVELAVFPSLCGLLLNLTTIPIFANATLKNRLELYSSSPYSAMLITWLVGTCFMFTFAMLVSACRESLRAGVCWWIRDPSDDRFNPIREILERSAWSQVKKISASAVMYGAVIVCGLGSIVFNLVFFTGTLPLRIHADRPLSSSALDLVIYQIGLPFFLECFQPRTKLKKTLQVISRSIARQLRLTCYLYGQRQIEEETFLEVIVRGSDGRVRSSGGWARFSPMRWFVEDRSSAPTVSKRLDRKVSIGSTSKGSISRRRKWAGGSFARVPASDAVKVVPGRKMHIPVHADGTPIDPADRSIIEQQQAEAREEGGLAGVDHYTVVYLPPQFQARILCYVISMWSAAVILGWQLVGIPLLIGRFLLDRFLMVEQDEPHDVYAYAIGMLSCAVILSVGNGLWERYLQFSRTFDPEVGWITDEEESEEEGSEERDEEDEGSESPASNLILAIRNDAGRPQRRQRMIDLMDTIRSIRSTIHKFLHGLLFILGGGIILPILASTLVELYLLGLMKPKRNFENEIGGSDDGHLPSVYLIESWSYGCLHLSIGARLIRLLVPNHPFSTVQDQVMILWRTGNYHEMIRRINLKMIIPLGYMMLLSIIIPFLIVEPIMMMIHTDRPGTELERVHVEPKVEESLGGDSRGRADRFFRLLRIFDWEKITIGSSSTPNVPLDSSRSSPTTTTRRTAEGEHPEAWDGRRGRWMELNYLMLRLIYPLILSWFSQFYLVRSLVKLFSNWLEKVRDERFLERRRLKNYEPPQS